MSIITAVAITAIDGPITAIDGTITAMAIDPITAIDGTIIGISRNFPE